uniref:Uncharacterized protein n=1 Tax=Anguilla anguilla TaxID=7936 RepID=A0A0E9QJG8_ANGAN
MTRLTELSTITPQAKLIYPQEVGHFCYKDFCGFMRIIFWG